MIVEEPNYCCPNCFEGFDVEIEVYPDIPWVANTLLEDCFDYIDAEISAGGT